MSRTVLPKIQIKSLLYCCLLVPYLSGCQITETKVEQSKVTSVDKPKNVVLIVGDDHGYADIGALGLKSDVKTPALDRLAHRGTVFKQAYATAPICNASRTGLISGLYTQRAGTYWYGGPGLENSDQATMAEAFQNQGYKTGYVGKFHYGQTHDINSRNFPNNHGFDSFYGFSGGRKHYLIHSTKAQREAQKLKRKHDKNGESLAMGPVWINKQKKDQTGFATELLGLQARQFLNDNQHQPFFLQVSFNAVHNFTHQLPKEYLEANGLKGYHDWDPRVESFRDWYTKGRYPNNPEGREHYLGQLHYLDKEVGHLLDELQRLELADDTIVIYIGDNGGSTPIYADNGPLKGSKYTLYEGGIRVPLIIVNPNSDTANMVSQQVVSALDIYPTLMELLNMEPNVQFDGESLASLWTTPNNSINKLNERPLIWDTGHELAVRHGKWKYRASFDDYYAVKQHVGLELGEFLYDLESDPSEQTNLAEKHPDIVASMKQIYRQWQQDKAVNTNISTLTKQRRKQLGL